MIAVLITLIILTLFAIIIASISVYVAYRSLIAFLAKEEQHAEYRRYLRYMLDEMEESSIIFRTSLAQRVGSVPEWSELNKLLQTFETKINSFKSIMREFLSTEE